jgi:hypothetical protein
MGTQQILLIVLSVIIVGVAIAVGITMFNNQAYNSNQTSIASENQNYAAQVIQWWKTPESLGGAGQVSTNVDVTKIAAFLGFASTGVLTGGESGEFKITAVDATAGSESVEITALGKETKANLYPQVITTITLSDSGISAEVSTSATNTFAAEE